MYWRLAQLLLVGLNVIVQKNASVRKSQNSRLICRRRVIPDIGQLEIATLTCCSVSEGSIGCSMTVALVIAIGSRVEGAAGVAGVVAGVEIAVSGLGVVGAAVVAFVLVAFSLEVGFKVNPFTCIW